MELFFNDLFWSSELGLQSKLRANPATAGPGASSRFLPHSAPSHPRPVVAYDPKLNPVISNHRAKRQNAKRLRGLVRETCWGVP